MSLVRSLFRRSLSTKGSTGQPGPCSVTFEDVSKAYFRIRSGVVETKCNRSWYMSETCGMEIFTKNEALQISGSFKERGARNSLMLLSPEKQKQGVIAASAGNHALALAYHGKLLGIPVTCIMPTVAPITKIARCRSFGANVIVAGAHIGEAKDLALNSSEYEGMTYINGYDDPAIIAGAGTVGIEAMEQVAQVDAIVVPVGGAGLIAGVALAVKALRPSVKVIGVEPVRCASFQAALLAGCPVKTEMFPTLADGLAVPEVGPTAFEVARLHVDHVVSVTERDIALGMLRIIENEKQVVEGGGAAALAALLPGAPLHEMLRGQRVIVPLSGGNVDTPMLGRVIERGLAADGRLVRFSVTISDRPGGLAKLTECLAGTGICVKDITHERAWRDSVDQVKNLVVAETEGPEHVARLKLRLEEMGYVVKWF